MDAPDVPTTADLGRPPRGPAARLAACRTGRGPAVVLLHGLGLDGRMWDGLVPHLVEADFEAVAVDARGHGRSAVADREVTIDELTADVERWLDAEGMRRPHLVGFSMGGMIAMRIAAAGRSLASLTLVSTSGEAEPPDRRAEYEKLLDDFRGKPMTDTGADLFLAYLFAPDWLEAHPEVRARYARIAKENDHVGVYRASIAVVRRSSVMDRMARIAAPTLVVAGTADISASRKGMVRLADAIPGARLFELAGAAHLLNEERPDAFHQAVLAHLEEHP